ncbi:MAG: DUF2851 family protein [Bacteroidetes bacterium]|nr:DUF2851 family protein [Bacteroidota bacterium]
MHKEPKVSESSLYQVWKNQRFKSSLKTGAGEEITVLDAGNHNDSTSGPDFKNARIRIGNLTYVGDIEIDSNYSDWKSHGHNIDNKYSKVVLHASLFNRNHYGFVYTRDGRKIPSICLSEFIDQSIFENFRKEASDNQTEAKSDLKCSDAIKAIESATKEKFLYQLGAQRFEKKCKKVYDRLKEIQFLKELHIKEPVVSYELTGKFHEKEFKHSDFVSKEIWMQLFYELVFEALGYSKNKSQMMSLAQAANIPFLLKIEQDGVIIEKYESALFNISGLANSKESVTEQVSKEYLERISLHWNSIGSLYDGKTFDEAHWHFFRLRPQNFPTVRIAGGARLLKELIHNNLIGTLAKKIVEIHNLTVLINSLRSLFVIRSDGFWRNHYVLDQPANGEIKYFIGASRADEIVVNVILPFFAVYFEVFGNQNVSKKILKIYGIYEQKSENQIITDVAEALKLKDLMKRTIYSQGMIELFRNFCSKNKCLECEIGKMVFN